MRNFSFWSCCKEFERGFVKNTYFEEFRQGHALSKQIPLKHQSKKNYKLNGLIKDIFTLSANK